MRAPESVILRREPEVRDRIGSGWSCVCKCRRHASARSARRFRLPREFCQEGRGAACPMRPCSRHRFRTDACGYFAITRRGYPARTSPARAATQKSLPNGRLAVQGKRRNDTSRAMSFPTLALPRSGSRVSIFQGYNLSRPIPAPPEYAVFESTLIIAKSLRMSSEIHSETHASRPGETPDDRRLPRMAADLVLAQEGLRVCGFCLTRKTRHHAQGRPTFAGFRSMWPSRRHPAQKGFLSAASARRGCPAPGQVGFSVSFVSAIRALRSAPRNRRANRNLIRSMRS